MAICKQCGAKISEILGSGGTEQKETVRGIDKRGINIPKDLCKTCSELHIGQHRVQGEGHGHNGPAIDGSGNSLD